MLINRNTGLVLEGGGMRGVFTSGVLDAFMKYELYFDYVVSVSAGACNGMSYMSRQPRRARISNIDMLAKYHYISVRNLITQGCIFDADLLYDKFPNELVPFDYAAYLGNSATMEMVTTNCLTGRPCYLSDKTDPRRAVDICRASSSLPFLSRIVYVDGIPMLDGGIVDSIPLERSLNTGHSSNVVVLTRNRGYRSRERDRKIPPFIYKRFPRLRLALSHRVRLYNSQMAMVEEMEDKGRILVLRPLKPVEVGRMEKNIERLERLYEEGFLIGEEFCGRYLKEKG